MKPPLTALPQGLLGVGLMTGNALRQGYGIQLQQRGLLAPGNLDLNQRPTVHNPDGSISTVRSMSVNFDGREYLIPTISDDGRALGDDDAIQLFQQTGQHLGVFDTPEAATAWAERLHNEQAAQYGNALRRGK